MEAPGTFSPLTQSSSSSQRAQFSPCQRRRQYLPPHHPHLHPPLSPPRLHLRLWRPLAQIACQKSHWRDCKPLWPVKCISCWSKLKIVNKIHNKFSCLGLWSLHNNNNNNNKENDNNNSNSHNKNYKKNRNNNNIDNRNSNSNSNNSNNNNNITITIIILIVRMFCSPPPSPCCCKWWGSLPCPPSELSPWEKIGWTRKWSLPYDTFPLARW